MKHSPGRPLTPVEFEEHTGVGGDVVARLAAYLDVLKKWQARINLVGNETLVDPWRRHILDSAQLVPLIPRGAAIIVDLGSGAGFPGLVLAVLGKWRVHLVESNARKGAFLREAARLLEVTVDLHIDRIETMTPIPADVITARACAPLTKLLGYAHPFKTAHTICLFHKGRGYQEELTESSKTWQINAQAIPSKADPAGIVLKIEGFGPHA